ncbi:hypothetical protein AAHA92_25928 [Salvia divinorum]|uniref:Uncharacterized protein n=1 Tax=Salvia divinorum TaxID=28513 RepID=A0ABD1GC90_SALDI
MVINLRKLIGEDDVGGMFGLVWLVLASASVMSLIVWKCAQGVQQKEVDAADIYGGSGCAAACGGGCGA